MNSLLNRLVACVLVCGVNAAQLTADERPNILWIYVDDMSDWMGCYGDTVADTPHIDRLARRGVLFQRVYMPAPVCSTTRSALITGAMQTTYGLHNHRTMIKLPLPEQVTTVPELFRSAGYLTFNEAKDDYNFKRDRAQMYSPEFNRPTRKQVSGHLIGTDLTWLEQLKGSPFFGQIQLKGGKLGGETGSKYPAPSRVSEDKVTVPPQYPDIPVFRNAVARHYEQIAETDVQVGAIMDALRQYGLYENTAVFFFTDHGSPLPRSKQFLYEEGTRVPLIVHWPNGTARIRARGQERTDLVSGIDITAASLGLAGLDRPAFMEGRDFFSQEESPRRVVISARDRMGNAIDRIRSVTSDQFRYIRNSMLDRPLFQPQYRDGYATFTRLRELYEHQRLSPLHAAAFTTADRSDEELYDLRNDPHQIINLAKDPRYAKVIDQHRNVLDAWQKQTDDKGLYPESPESLRLVFQSAMGRCVNPEYNFLKNETGSK